MLHKFRKNKAISKIILDKLKKDKKLTKFIGYLKNYPFKLNPQICNL